MNQISQQRARTYKNEEESKIKNQKLRIKTCDNRLPLCCINSTRSNKQRNTRYQDQERRYKSKFISRKKKTDNVAKKQNKLKQNIGIKSLSQKTTDGVTTWNFL